MELFAKLFSSLLAFVYHCFDRIVIHGYLSGLSRPEQVVYFFRNVTGVPVVDKGALSKRTGEYRGWVEAFAWNHKIPMEWAQKVSVKKITSGPGCAAWSGPASTGCISSFKAWNRGRRSAVLTPMETSHDRCIDYIEFPCTDTSRVKAFYGEVLGWKFKDWGPGYTSFHDGRIAGGFTTDAQVSAAGPLVVLYAADLEGIRSKVLSAGGKVVRETFDFPGGRRFHFADPEGNILAVWSDPL